MKMNVEFESREELLSFVSMFGATPVTAAISGEKCGQAAPVKADKQKEEAKPAAEKVKKDKTETKKEEPKVEEKKEEVTKVNAEVTGIDETPTEESPKDAEIKEENSGDQVEVTKEMVRAICSKAIKAGKSAEVKNIVSKYGAAKLPDLKEECYADAYKDVEALL